MVSSDYKNDEGDGANANEMTLHHGQGALGRHHGQAPYRNLALAARPQLDGDIHARCDQD